MMNTKQLSTLGLICTLATSFVACNRSNEQQGSAQNSGSVGGNAFTPSAAFFTIGTSAAAVPVAAVDPNVLAGNSNPLVNPNAVIPLPGNANSLLPGQVIGLAIVKFANACDQQQANENSPDNAGLLLTLSGITQPGTYTLTPTSAGQTMDASTPDQNIKNLTSIKAGAGGTVTGAYLATNGQCKGTPNIVQSGTLTLTAFDTAQSISGSYEVTLASGDKLSGTFSAASCPANTSSSPATCGG